MSSTVGAFPPHLKQDESTSESYRILKNYVNGKWITSRTQQFLPVMDPSIGRRIAEVPLSTAPEVDEAVRAAQKAFPSWSAVPIKERAQVFYRYKTLLEKNAQSLAELVHEENGKTMSEAMAEVEKAIE